MVRIVNKGETPQGIAVSDFSDEGKEYVVEAIGDKVEHLEVGDRVLVIGVRGATYDFLPNTQDLFIIKEAGIPLVYGKAGE